MAGMAQYWYSDFVLLRSLGENSAMCPAIFSIIILLYNVNGRGWLTVAITQTHPPHLTAPYGLRGIEFSEENLREFVST